MHATFEAAEPDAAPPRVIRAGGQRRRVFVPPTVRTICRNVISLEVLFALCFYSNVFQFLLPSMTLDPTILLALPTVPWALWVVYREGIYTRGLPVLMAYMLFIIWPVFTRMWTPAEMLASRYILYYWSIDLWFILIAAFVFANNRERAMRFVMAVLGLALIVTLFGLYIYFTYGDFRFASKTYTTVADVHDRIYNKWGYATTAGTIIAFVVATRARFLSAKQILYTAAFLFTVFFLLISSSRGSLVAAVGAIAVGMAIGLPRLGRGEVKIQRAQIIMVGLIAVICAYVVYALNSGAADFHTFDRFQKLLDESQDPSMVQGPNRFAYYAAAVHFWINAPLLGNGVGAFSHLFYGTDILGAQPHNIILELLCDYGVIGLALFAVFAWSAARQVSYRRLREDPLYFCIFLLFVTRWLQAMYTQELSAQFPMLFFLALLILRPLPGTVAAQSQGAMRRLRFSRGRQRRSSRRAGPDVAVGGAAE